MGNCSTSSLKEAFEDVSSSVDGKISVPVQHTPNRMLLLDPRSPLVDGERTPIERLKYEMGSCSLVDLKRATVSSNTDDRLAGPIDNTPDRMVLHDPRSPLVDAERTPIEVFKSAAITSDADKTDDEVLNTRQLADPRSATAGIQRTPILVESPLQLENCGTESSAESSNAVDDDDAARAEPVAVTSTPVLVVQTQEKVLPIAKKLSFDVSPLPKKNKKAEVSSQSHSRSPLGELQANSSIKSDSLNHRQVGSKVKVQGPMSPLQLLHVRQRMAVKRALQLTQKGENCPPQADNCVTAVNSR